MHYASYYRWLIIQDWVRVTASDRLLDVGCDDGEIIARMPAALRIGVDLNPRSPDPHTIWLVRSTAQSLPLPSGYFSAVFAFDLIEHVEQDQVVLAELVRVLAPNGTLWLSTPCADFAIFPRWLMGRATQSWGHVRNGYTVAELERKLPGGMSLDVMIWNEPFLRACYLGLRILNSISPAMARSLARVCLNLDRSFTQGLRGHLFVRIRKNLPLRPQPPVTSVTLSL